MKRPLLAFVFSAVALSAQTSSPSASTLSLAECLQLAAEKHPALTAAQAGVSAAGEAVGEARAPLYPQLDLGAGYHRWQRRAFLPGGLVIPGRGVPELIGPLDDWNAALLSRLTLFDAGERRAGIDAARARLAGAQAEAGAAAADIRLGVHAAFYTLAAARDLADVARQNVERATGHRRLAEARAESGAVPQADVLRTEGEVAAARLQQITADSRVRIATGRLNAAIGRPAEAPLVITLPADAPLPPAAGEISALIARALARRPEITAGAKRAEAARAAVSGARAARSPKVRADGSFGWRDTDFLPENHEWQAGISVELPLFDSGARARRLARSRAELAREEAVLEQRRLQVREEVWSASTELERAWSAIAATETSVRASEESLRIIRERYERGVALVTDLLDTQTALARAEASLAEARWTYRAARAGFDRAMGDPGP